MPDFDSTDIYMTFKRRWTLLKHIGSPNDLKGFHYDLLLEDRDSCRSWRLAKIPELDGLVTEITSIPPHNLSWLETEGRSVSGDRGWASPIASGHFLGDLPILNESPCSVQLIGDPISGF